MSETFRDIMWIFFFGIHKNKLLDDFVPTRYVLLSARYAFLVLPMLPMIDRKLQLNKNISFLLRYLDQFGWQGDDIVKYLHHDIDIEVAVLVAAQFCRILYCKML